MSESKGNVRIAGSGIIDSGKYEEIRISGSCHFKGAIDCKSLAVSGASNFQGDLDCSGDIRVSGSLKTDGGIKAASAHISGSVSAAGAVNIKDMRISGRLSVGESCTSTETSVSGAIKVAGDLSAEKLTLRGPAEIGGLLNADEINIELGHGNGCSNIGSIGGGSVRVARREDGGFVIFGFCVGHSYCTLKTSSIEADRVELESTTADTVRAIDAVIGAGCQIGTVEYSGAITVSDDAKVDKVVKVGE